MRIGIACLLILVACGDDNAPRDGGTDAPPTDAGVDVALDATTDVPTDVPTDVLLDRATDVVSDGGPGPVLVDFWGGLGTEPGQFIEPSSVEIDTEGFVYVAGHENRFQKFTGDGELVAIYGTPGSGDGEFNHPHGLAVDRVRSDLIYVGDQENDRLQVFMPDGTFIRQWGDALFQHIHDVGIDPSTGDVFVGDLESNIVRRFTPTGSVVWQVGGPGTGPGQFNGIWGMSTDSDGNIYIADSANDRVQVLDRDGGFLREWNTFEGAPFIKPTGIYVHTLDATVYLCDSLDQTILVFDLDGNPLERWSLPEITGLTTEPEDIVLDAAGENIYIAEVRQAYVLHLSR